MAMADKDMNQIHVFFHEAMLQHDNGYGVFDTFEDPGFLDVLEPHPENADRIRNIRSILQRGPIAPFITWHQSRPAAIESLTSFHTPGQQTLILYLLHSFAIGSICSQLLTLCKSLIVSSMVPILRSVLKLLSENIRLKLSGFYGNPK